MSHSIRRTLGLLGATAIAVTGAAALTTGLAQPAGAATIGAGVTNLAIANIGKGSCDINSLGGTGFGTSCTGNGGNPEAWSGDFVAWDWTQEGINPNPLTTSTGSATPGTIYTYGESHLTWHSSTAYTPQPGDAIIYNSSSGVHTYATIVTAVNPDGTLQTVGGDWGNNGPAETTVATFTLQADEIAVGSTPAALKGDETIAGYVSPVPQPGYDTSLAPFGAITWTPPGATSARTDVYAADATGALWDYTHQANTPAAITAAPTQVENGWTHYRPVGLADMNHDGYPDLVVIDADTDTLEVFLGSANGLSDIASTLPYSGGWTTDFVPFGVTDWNHSGNFGVVALQVSTGTAWFYPGDLSGGAGDDNNYHQQISTGWSAGQVPVGVDDLTGDGHADLLYCDTGDNAVWLVPGDGTGGQDANTEITACNSGQTFFGLTDYSGDGDPDLITRNDATGLVSVAPAGPAAVGSLIATGTATLKSLAPFGAITWTAPGATAPHTDIYAADPAGNLWDYAQAPGAALSTAPTKVATGWTHYTPVGVADMNHDGYPDLVVVDQNTTTLEVFTGSATGLSTTPQTMAYSGGWTDGFVPFGVVDYDNSGHFGVIAAELSTGNLWFYPGDLTGGEGDSSNFHTQIGGGWDSRFVPVGAGNFSGSGYTDILACRTDTNGVSLYPGSSNANWATDTEVMTDCGNDTFFGLTDYDNTGTLDVIARDNSNGNMFVAQGDGHGWWQSTTNTTVATNW